MAAEILRLAELISKSVATLVKTCEDNKLPLPTLNDPYTPESEVFLSHSVCSAAVTIIAAATSQLAAVVGPPQLSIMNMAGSVRVPPYSVDEG